MSEKTVRQYQLEERSMIAARIKNSVTKVRELFDVMTHDKISSPEKVAQLSKELAEHHQNNIFLKCQNMGEIVLENLRLVLAKDFKQSMRL